VLTTDTDVPVMTETSVTAGLLQTLNLLTVGGVQDIRNHLGGLTGGEVLLTIQEPGLDLELERVVAHSDDLVDLVSGHLTSALVVVDVTLLQDEKGETTTDTLDGSHGKWDLATTIDVGVAHTQNVLEILGHKVKRHGGKSFFYSNSPEIVT
jgi:hypothetical protein